VRLRVPGALAAIAAAAAILASSSPAQSSATAGAHAAVVSGSLGTVASVHASGDQDASRSAPSKTPKGIGLGGGSATASTARGGGDASAEASAEARDVDLLDGLVTADSVSRAASADGKGKAGYDGGVENLAIGDQAIGDVSAGKSYDLPDGAGTVVVNRDGAGLKLTLTAAVGSYAAGTEVTVADVGASARDGAATPTPTPTATPTPRATATPTPSSGGGGGAPKAKKPPSYKKRLMSTRFRFPVRGKTTIGGPFGAFRADTGFHEGNDLFAAFGTPVVAVADGTVENVGSLKISGNRLWVYADTGDQFFYAHLSAFSPDAVDHARVKAGTVLGYVGNTGDAEPTPSHLHFEIHPDGGKAVDPHPFLVAWQGRMGDAASDTAERPGALVEVRDLIGDG
jgi:murein DD-endopeptidase MepM/ murein hydrolase activator NlpD